jgi:uncharacterized protein YqeY
MSIEERMDADFKDAFKSGLTERKNTLSLIRSAFHNRKIERGAKNEGMTDDEAIAVLLTEAKRRKDAIIEYEKAGRTEQAAKEKAELATIEEYLPQQLASEEIRNELKKILIELGDEARDLGRIMGVFMQRFKGRADGTIVREEAQKLLSE